MALEKSTLGLLTLVSQDQLGALAAALAEWKIREYRLDGRGINDTATFWRQAGEQLALPGGDSAPTSWSAFTDRLWERCYFDPADEVALVWTDAQHMLNGGLGDLLLASDALLRLGRQLHNPSSANTRPKPLYLFLVGAGPNFPPI